MNSVSVDGQMRGDTGPRLVMSLQATVVDGFKLQRLLRQIGTETRALQFTHGAQLVVIGGSKRGLAVAYECQGSHVLIFRWRGTSWQCKP